MQAPQVRGPVATLSPPLPFVAATSNDFGGIGLEFYKSAVKPYFVRAREGDRGLEALAGTKEIAGWRLWLGRPEGDDGDPADG